MKLTPKATIIICAYLGFAGFALLSLSSFWLAGPGYIKDGYDTVRVWPDRFPERAHVGDHLICDGPLGSSGEIWHAGDRVVKRGSELTLTRALAAQGLTCSLTVAGKRRTSPPIELEGPRSRTDQAKRWIVANFGDQLAKLILLLTAPVWIGGLIFAGLRATATETPPPSAAPTHGSASKPTAKAKMIECPDKHCYKGTLSRWDQPDEICPTCRGRGEIAAMQ